MKVAFSAKKQFNFVGNGLDRSELKVPKYGGTVKTVPYKVCCVKF